MAEKKYYQGVGRRKTATAQVRIFPEGKEDEFIVNDKDLGDYFSKDSLIKKARAPLEAVDLRTGMGVTVLARGGGVTGQAEAIRHGLARALVHLDPELRDKMRELDYLTRDPRMKERKKPGLKKARKAPQWSKR